ncbi:MAG: glycosyltransferase [Desulfarculus sp.]|nr:glycosyltransferase [Desulfarculus sp.]
MPPAKGKQKPPTPSKQGPAPHNRPTISCCMMVKNEEKRLPTALASVRPWVDEIIVVDTGSTDRTVEIAQEFGATIYHHPWEYNFSVHRNQSISYASGDWLFIFDADEELDQETAPLLYDAVRAPVGINAFLIELYNDITAGGESFILHPRLFRNHVGFHYEGLVHNRPMVSGQVARIGVKLWHYGYNEDAETMEAKHQRRLSMIRKWAEDEPDNFLAHSYLAHTLVSRMESVSEAVDEAYRALELLKQEHGMERHYPHVYYPLINGLAILGRDQEVLRHAPDCLAKVPVYPDPLFFVVLTHYKHRQWEELVQAAERYWKLQMEARANPDAFVFFENMTLDQMNLVLLRWVVAEAFLGHEDRAEELFARMEDFNKLEQCSQQALATLLAHDFTALVQRLNQKVLQAHPEWTWPREIERLALEKLESQQSGELSRRGREALEAGRLAEAVEILTRAERLAPLSPEVLFDLGQALDRSGQTEQAIPWLTRGLDLFPGQPAAWRRLGDYYFGRGEYASAQGAYGRLLMLHPADETANSRLAVCQRRLAQAPPCVADQPPRLLVFLVGGLSLDLIKMPAPHFLMGRAWGELLLPDRAKAQNYPAWATIYTGQEPGRHGLTGETVDERAPRLDDLAVWSVWEIMAQSLSLGLVALPMGCPPPTWPVWALAGYPGGRLAPDLVHPPALAGQVLASGYRTDYVLTNYERQIVSQRLEADVRQEALLHQVERNKLTTAMALPAVEVLVVGLNALELAQQTWELTNYRNFAAYQQVYALIESTVAALRPGAFAVLSQRGYQHLDRKPDANGFYCLSWLRGENGKANATEIAPELLRWVGLDPSRLGQARG